MNNKSILAIFFASLANISTAMAAPVVLDDFEHYAIGDKVTLWNCWGNTPAGTGEIVADPNDSNNKVLHITISGWGNFAQFTLPEDLQGKALIENKRTVSLRIYRTNSDQNEWKKVQIYQDKALLYEDDGYPSQGSKGVWQSRTYDLPASTSTFDYGTNGGKILALGFNSDASDYYIDDVTLKAPYDDYETIEGTVTKDFTGQNTSSSYKTCSTPFRMLEGSNLILNTARYTYITSPVVGTGRIDIYSGGERTYLGGSDKKSPDWSGFKGDVHIWPYKDLSSSNGFYGLVWMHNGKTFSPDNAEADMAEGKANSTLRDCHVTLHNGTTIASESGVRGIRIGHLDMEEGSTMYGYMKSKTGNNGFYVVGYTGDDAVLAGRIAPYSDNTAMLVGIVKEGLGTYRITGNTNLITGAVRVLRGKVMFNNDAITAKAQKLSGSTGTPASASTTGLYVMKNGTAGGTGSIACATNVYGILEPGDNSISSLTFADYAKGQDISLILRPTARIDCEINGSTEYDNVIVEGPVSYYNINQEFETTDQMPRLRIRLTNDARLSVGDEFTLMTAKSKASYNDVPWQFNIIYPKAYTWQVEQVEDSTGFKVVAHVTSLDYSGQGDVEDKDEESSHSTDDGVFDVTAEQVDATPLRTYAEDIEGYIGTCVPVWTINVDNDNESRSKLIAEQYNMVVCENEMKFDATEPSQGSFDYYHGDRLVSFAQRHNLRIRGHALAWHSQVPTWLTSDGKKNSMNRSREELLSILHNHIKNVVTHWKGKVAEWDVANEVLDDNQQTIYSNPSGYDLRPSVWATGIGEDFLDSAFVWTHKYDPDAKLILNDYGAEGKGWGKSEALYNLAMRLRNSGIPIDGIGLQCHMDAGISYASSIEENVARCQQAGLLCRITELDLGIDGATDQNLATQAQTYYQMARMAMKYDNCKSMMIWGLSDDLTWRTGKNPLLFKSDLSKKPAYWAVHAALRQATGKEIVNAIEKIESDTALPLSNAIYNLQGQKVNTMSRGHVYIINGKKIIGK